MSRVVRKALLIQLALIEAVHEKLQGSLQRFWAAGKTTRSASQPCQVMAQLSLITFNRVSVRFALGDSIAAPVIPQTVVGIEGITIVALGLGSFIHHLLNDFLTALPDHFEAQIAASETIYDCDDEDLLFLSPIKVNNSSFMGWSSLFKNFSYRKSLGFKDYASIFL